MNWILTMLVLGWLLTTSKRGVSRFLLSSVLCLRLFRRFRRGPDSSETISERVLALYGNEKRASEKHGVSRITSASSFYTPCDIDDVVDGGKSIGGTVSRRWDTSAPDRWRIRTWPTPPTQIDKTRYVFRRFDGADAPAPSPPPSDGCARRRQPRWKRCFRVQNNIFIVEDEHVKRCSMEFFLFFFFLLKRGGRNTFSNFETE